MSNTDTIGSLVIDLRANVAQLRVDMDSVKDTIAQSTKQITSQMKSDFAETKQTLALISADGFGIPRELRSVIASSELARTAILGIKDAILGIAFIDLGIKAFEKISQYVDASQKAAAEEAKYTQDTAIAAQNAVDATVKRKEQLDLIGKGEEDRAAIQDKFFKTELRQNTIRLQGLQGELAARMAILASYDAQRPATLDTAAGAEAGIDDNTGTGQTGLSASSKDAYSKFAQEHKAEIDALNKAIADANAGIKTNDLQLHDFEQGLDTSRINNAEKVALQEVELYQDTIQKEFAAGQIGVDQELMGLRTAATEKYNIQAGALQDTLDILEQDPSRNKEKIEALQTQLQVIWLDYEKTLTDIKAQGVADRKKLLDQQTALEAAAAQQLIASNKDHGLLPADLATSFITANLPRLDASLAAFKQHMVDNFNGPLKDGAAQSKLLEQAMEGLLTPTAKFEILQAEIAPLIKQYQAWPDAVKALNNELLRANPEFEKLQRSSEQFGKDLSNEIEQMVISGKSFHDVLVSLLQDLEKIVLEATLLQPLQDFFKGGSSTTGGFPGILASLFGLRGSAAAAGSAASAGAGVGGVGGGLSSILSGIPFFADGGNPPVGQLSLVGENGPELFMPNTPGTIIPNDALGGDTYYFSIDARGAAPGAEAAMVRGLQRALEQNRQQSVASAIDYQRRR